MAPADDTPRTSPAMLSQAEAATACGVSVATIRRARKAGKIPGVQPDSNGGYRIPVSSLLAAGFTLDQVTRTEDVPPLGTPQHTPTDDALHQQLQALRARAIEAERRAAVAEALADERARSLEDMRTAMRAIAAAPPSAPEPEAKDCPPPPPASSPSRAQRLSGADRWWWRIGRRNTHPSS